MKKLFSKTVLALLVLNFSFLSFAKADPMKEFLTTCAYGTIGGALVGAASLAFTDKPDGSLNNIARGASLGLYAGILFGAYVAYAIPSPTATQKPSDLGFYPVFTDSLALDGAQVNYTMFRF